MDCIGFASPMLPGQTEAARAFQRELAGARQDADARSERAIGITRELWFLQRAANGDLVVASMESADVAKALGLFAAWREPFDVWFKDRLAAVTGVDLNAPPPGPPSELVSHDEAA
jgi:hypothetical protein